MFKNLKMRTTMKSTILWEENKMKILEDYKKIAHELLFEVDDEKMIKYKDKDGESKEMKAGSAKTMPKDHPAKQAWDKMQDGGGDDKEKPSGQKIGGSEFDRIQISDPDDEDSEVGKYLKSKGMTGYDDSDDEGDIDRSKFYGGRGFGDDEGKEYYDISGDDTMGHLSPEEQTKLVQFFNPEQLRTSSGHEPNPKDFEVDKQGYVHFGDLNDKDSPGDYDIVAQIKDDTTHDELKARIKQNVGPIMDKYYKQFGAGAKSDGGDAKRSEFEVDTDPKKYAGLESYEASMAKSADKEIAQHGNFGDGTSLPPGTDFRTKLDDLDEDDVEAFYDEVAEKYAEEYDITMGVMDDNKNILMDEEGMTMSDLVSGIKSSAEEAAAEGGYMKYGESVKPKKKPFLREQLERFGGGRY